MNTFQTIQKLNKMAAVLFYHLKTEPFKIQTDPYHLNTKNVRTPTVLHREDMAARPKTFNNITVGARIPNAFGIRMVHSRSVQAPTIRIPNHG